MRAVAQVAEPCLQRGRVVLFDVGAAGADGGAAGDGGPFARGGDEGEVDVGVGGEIVSFSGLGIGVKEEVYAVLFLYPQTRFRFSEGNCMCFEPGGDGKGGEA